MDVGLGSFGSDISIHAPRTGSDDTVPPFFRFISIFQSTLPARGATMILPEEIDDIIFQSTLPARGATTTRHSPSSPKSFQSTLPARGATEPAVFIRVRTQFQSTLPARGATVALAR